MPRDKVASADGDFDSVDALFPNAKVIRIDVNTSRLSTRSSEDYSCCLSDVINNYFWTLDDYEKVCQVYASSAAASWAFNRGNSAG